MTVSWADGARRAAFERWLAPLVPRHGLRPETLMPASADASFRRYLRMAAAGATAGPRGHLIVMDAPPPQENVRPFVQVAGLVERAGLNAPRVLEADADAGFLLLTDLGSTSYLDALRSADAPTADRLMRAALRALVRWQRAVPAASLPRYDAAALQLELDLFADWCVEREFGITWGAAERAAWRLVCERLIASALAQPQLAVHADYMPRNLMVADDDAANPGILDFQDAVSGPITYDLASLLRDAFWSWDEEREIDWAVRWWQQARAEGLPVDADFAEFWRALEWMAAQRHLKVAGIFCRLKHRDGKAKYAADLPRFFGYLSKTALRYKPLSPLLDLLAPLSGEALKAGFTF